MQTKKCTTRGCKTKPLRGNICNKCNSRRYRKKYPGHAAYYRKKWNAKVKGIAFTISRSAFIQVWKPGLDIDRIDGLRGYHEGNIRATSTLINRGFKAQAEKKARYIHEPDADCGF